MVSVDLDATAQKTYRRAAFDVIDADLWPIHLIFGQSRTGYFCFLALLSYSGPLTNSSVLRSRAATKSLHLADSPHPCSRQLLVLCESGHCALTSAAHSVTTAR